MASFKELTANPTLASQSQQHYRGPVFAPPAEASQPSALGREPPPPFPLPSRAVVPCKAAGAAAALRSQPNGSAPVRILDQSLPISELRSGKRQTRHPALRTAPPAAAARCGASKSALQTLHGADADVVKAEIGSCFPGGGRARAAAGRINAGGVQRAKPPQPRAVPAAPHARRAVKAARGCAHRRKRIPPIPQ